MKGATIKCDFCGCIGAGEKCDWCGAPRSTTTPNALDWLTDVPRAAPARPQRGFYVPAAPSVAPKNGGLGILALKIFGGFCAVSVVLGSLGLLPDDASRARTAPPPVAVSTPEPTASPVAVATPQQGAHQAHAATTVKPKWVEVSRERVDAPGVPRASIRIIVPAGVTRVQLEGALAQALRRVDDDARANGVELKAVMAFAYTSGTDTAGEYTAGRGVLAPGGDWGNARSDSASWMSFDVARDYQLSQGAAGSPPRKHPATSARPTQAPTPKTSHVDTLDNGSPGPVLVATTAKDMREMDEVCRTHDDAGLTRMMAEGRVAIVPSSTKVRVLGQDSMGTEIRILDGKYENRTGYVLSEFVKRH